MLTYEKFNKRIKNLGYELQEDSKRIYVTKTWRTFASISKENRYQMSTQYTEFRKLRNGEKKQELFNLVALFSSGDPKERFKEPKFFITLSTKYIWDLDTPSYLNYDEMFNEFKFGSIREFNDQHKTFTFTETWMDKNLNDEIKGSIESGLLELVEFVDKDESKEKSDTVYSKDNSDLNEIEVEITNTQSELEPNK